MHRPTVGWIAICLLLLSAALALFFPEQENYAAFQAASLRIGLIMAVLWLALPETRQINPWVAVAAVLAATIIIIRPRFLIPTLVVLLAFAFLWPRQGKGRRPTSRRQRPD